jgi:hypothetical protein
MTIFTPGPQTHHESSLRWFMQAQRTGFGGNWMVFIMSFRPQTPQKWAWISWEIAPTKLTDFAPFLLRVWQAGGQILREFLSVFYCEGCRAMDLDFRLLLNFAWCSFTILDAVQVLLHAVGKRFWSEFGSLEVMFWGSFLVLLSRMLPLHAPWF